MSRTSYVRDVWLPENGPWLALVSVIVGCLTAPQEASAARQALAWMLASTGWFALFLVLVGVVWRPWVAPPPEAEPPEDDPSGKVVPLRRRPGGLHRARTPRQHAKNESLSLVVSPHGGGSSEAQRTPRRGA